MGKRRSSSHLLSPTAEQALISAAQGGSKQAIEMLVAVEMPFIHSLAKRIARHNIHRPDIESDIEDLTHVGVAELLRKIPRYDRARSYNAEHGRHARLRSIAFLDMSRAMNRVACDSLESVRLPRESRIHRAHRDLERGMPMEQLRREHPGVSEGALRSLHRTTVSIEQLREDEEISEETDGFGEPMIDRIWNRLSMLDRKVISLLRLELPTRDRAVQLGVSIRNLRDVESSTFERIRALTERLENEEPVDPLECGFRRRVWDRLARQERAVLVALKLLVDRPLAYRADLLGVEPGRVRPMERTVLRRVRQMCC